MAGEVFTLATPPSPGSLAPTGFVSFTIAVTGLALTSLSVRPTVNGVVGDYLISSPNGPLSADALAGGSTYEVTEAGGTRTYSMVLRPGSGWGSLGDDITLTVITIHGDDADVTQIWQWTIALPVHSDTTKPMLDWYAQLARAGRP